MVLISLAFVSFISTLSGGLLALRFRKYIHLLLAFTAGVLIALWGMHLVPEIVELSAENGYGLAGPALAVVAGYGGFQIFHRVLHRHHSRRQAIGVASALALASHSFLDGVAIGVAFQINVEIGIVVAIAVIAHDFADGLNTVSVMLAYKNSIHRAASILILVSLAPVAGVIFSQFIEIPPLLLLWYLAGFAGFVVYLLFKDIFPQLIKNQQHVISATLMVMGALFIYSITGVLHSLE